MPKGGTHPAVTRPEVGYGLLFRGRLPIVGLIFVSVISSVLADAQVGKVPHHHHGEHCNHRHPRPDEVSFCKKIQLYFVAAKY
jgi:hypothetical protein